MEAAQAVPITEKLRNIKIGSYTVDHGSHSKHIAVAGVCQDAAQEIERLGGENSVLLGLLQDCNAVIGTIEGEDCDEADKLRDLRTAIYRATEPHRHKGELL